MDKKIGKYVASIFELFTRDTEYCKRKDIYLNDEDNLYPNRVERVERQSITAFSCAQKLKAFILGKGFVNPDLNNATAAVKAGNTITAYQLAARFTNSIKTHRGVYIHINYDLDGNIVYRDVLSFKKCRVSKEDLYGYSGPIKYKDWEEKKDKGLFGGGSKKKTQWFYPYDPNPEVIRKQMLRDNKGNVDENLQKNYRGQVMFINLDDTDVYPFAWVNSAYNDADTEYRISLYRNTNVRSGFLEKTIIIANGFVGDAEEKLHKDMKGWLGVENTSNIFVMTPNEEVEDPEKLITTVSLKGNYDSKRFEKDEMAIANNIRKCYLNIPPALVDATQGQLYGSSGEAFKQMIDAYNEETGFLRELLRATFNEIFQASIIGVDFEVKPLGRDTNQDQPETQEDDDTV